MTTLGETTQDHLGGTAPSPAPTGVVEAATEPSRRADAWRRFRRNRLAVAGLVVIVLLVICALFAPLIAPYDPERIASETVRDGPSADHLFGTDQVGRDIFSRILFGARVSLRVGIMATAIATVIGLVVGSLAGYFGGWVDNLTMRVTDILLAFPYILAAIAIITVVGPGERTVILVIGFLGWLSIARILRASILQVKGTEYIEAARAIGCGPWRIITRHLLPNAIQPVIVYATLFVGTAVLSEAALSFLSVGVQDPTPAWGLMVNQGRGFLRTAPHLIFFPGGAIFVMVVAFLLVGDGLRDALDPKLRR